MLRAARAALLALAFAVVPVAGAQAAVPSGFVGMVSEDVFANDAAYADTQLTKMVGARVSLLRQVFDWAQIEPVRGAWDWSSTDRFAGAAARHGIAVMPILFNTPDFASSRPAGSRLSGTYPPKRPAQFAAFAAAAVARYGPGGTFWTENPDVPVKAIRSWQVWNEPNLTAYWRPKPKASAYAALLRETSAAIRARDRGAEVVSAGLPESRIGVPLQTYLADLLRAGAGRSMDTLAINPYAPTAAGVVDLLVQSRRTLDRNGGRGIELRATEVGWSSGGPASPYRTTARGQAQRIGQLIRALADRRRSLRLLGFVYYDWRDARPYAGKDFWGLHTGLLTLGGRAKPALTAFGAAAMSIGAPFARAG